MAQIQGRIDHMPIFGIITIRKMYQEKLSDFWPATTLDAGDKYADRLDVFAFMTSRPNKHGYVNLGPTCFYTLEAIRGGRERGHLRT
ncbi:MAG: acetyl-CoA hydrolase, partial [Syntrophomonadaceae bacterium]|nr:acetyl-CoA hydrolase [Syntrophomonadaceae bacterium]